MPSVQVALAFLLCVLASRHVGWLFTRAGLPLISGFLLTGVAIGPQALGFLDQAHVLALRPLDEVALAFIAFAAGAELYLKELRDRLKAIRWVTLAQILAAFPIGTATLFFLSERIPFLRDLTSAERLGVAAVAGTILVARSPSSAIAIVSELRARGPFTRTVLGVTVLMDVVVIALFAVASGLASSLFGQSLGLSLVPHLALELAGSVLTGWAVGHLLAAVVGSRRGSRLKTGFILACGLGVFVCSAALRDWSHAHLPFELFFEPLLACMTAGVWAANRSPHRAEFRQLLSDVAPWVYVGFFTLTGASLALDVLARVWPVAVALCAARFAALYAGSLVGGTLAGDPARHNRLAGFAYVTQAGVGLGLAKEVAVEFAGWGTAFATLMIGVIVLNQLAGPPLFKLAIRRSGEVNPRAGITPIDGERDAIIFGLEGDSLALARLLESHGWKVKIASRRAADMNVADADLEIFPIHALDGDALRRLGAARSEALVLMLSDEENEQLCEVVLRELGRKHVVVRLTDRKRLDRFVNLGALVVHPSTAMVSLLDHSVRSPSATSLLLGLGSQDVVDVELRAANLHGLSLRDLRLPIDTLVVSIRRAGSVIVSHGYTRLRRGDLVTLVGSRESLQEIERRFET